MSRKRRNGVAVAVAVTLSVIATGCASSSSGGSSSGTVVSPAVAASGGGSSSAPLVGATLLSLQYPFLVKLNDAAKAEAAADNINLVSLDPRQQTSTELQQVENLITQKAKLIIMIPVDQKISQAAALLVNKANIPLVLVNTSFADFSGKYVSYVGSDDTKAGQIEGDFLVKQLPQGGNVIYLVGQYGAAGTERRKAGFDQEIKGHNLDVVTELQAHGSRAEAKTIMEDLLQKYPAGKVQAVIAQSDEMAIGAASAIAAAHRQSDFKVVMGIDGSADGLAAVKDGSLTATVFQDAVGQGKAAMDTAKKILDGQSVPKVVDLPFKLVTKDNLAQFTN